MLRLLLRLTVLGSSVSVVSAQPRPSDPAAVALADRAIARMGGETALRAVTSMRLDLMTQWQRTALTTHPYADAPSYERTVSLFDYRARNWRNTRTFLPSPAASVDIVRDTVGARYLTTPAGAPLVMPLNVAYVDERRELFAFAPERTMLLARDAAGLRALPDTVIAGVAHGRISAVVDGYPATWFLRRSDGLPSLVRFRADETNDFGLAPWGEQEIEVWWSGWSRVAPGVLIPRQRDVRRIGRPYKRMTVMAVVVNAPVPTDSFAIADSTSRLFLTSERRPMWAAPFDSARIIERDFATFPPFSGSAGAVRIGGQWVLLETAQVEGAVSAIRDWLVAQEPGARIGAGLVSSTGTGNGGMRWFAERRLPLFVAPGALPVARLILGVAGAVRATVVTSPRWVRVGTDSLWLERIDAPDADGTMLAYSPTHRWLYAIMLVGRTSTEPELHAAIARLRERGLAVDWVGGARGIRIPAPAATLPR